MTKVFINPGHSLEGKPDPGCSYNGIQEALICETIAGALAYNLKKNDIDVEVYQQCDMSKTSNEQLNKVPEVANKSNADLFISIHMNGFSDASAKGTETWYHKNSTGGKKLAELINAKLTRPFKNYTFKDRGAKEDTRNLLVLRATRMPAVLTEICFISNVNDANFIKNNVAAVSERLCEAICEYFGKTVKENTKKLEIRMEHQEEDKYDLYINGEVKLIHNRFQTCIDWLSKHYGV